MTTATIADTDIQPFLATIAERHYADLFAPCPTCDGRRLVVRYDARRQFVTEGCHDCDKPRRIDYGPRLIFADWLESDSPHQRELWAVEWSEFIRVCSSWSVA